MSYSYNYESSHYKNSTTSTRANKSKTRYNQVRQNNQQAVKTKDIITNMSPDHETTRNGGKRRLQTTKRVRRHSARLLKRTYIGDYQDV